MCGEGGVEDGTGGDTYNQQRPRLRLDPPLPLGNVPEGCPGVVPAFVAEQPPRKVLEVVEVAFGHNSPASQIEPRLRLDGHRGLDFLRRRGGRQRPHLILIALKELVFSPTISYSHAVMSRGPKRSASPSPRESERKRGRKSGDCPPSRSPSPEKRPWAPDTSRALHYQNQGEYTPPPEGPATPDAKAPDKEARTTESGTPPPFDLRRYGILAHHPNSPNMRTTGAIVAPNGEMGTIISKKDDCVTVLWQRSA